jgi:hypothetical protein
MTDGCTPVLHLTFQKVTPKTSGELSGKNFHYRSKNLCRTTILVIAVLLGACASNPSSAPADDEVAKGREQMIRAFDAAWVRVLTTNKLQQILDSEPAERPGAANSFVVRLADCLPLPDVTPYPENPVGLLKKVLDSGQLRVMVQNVPDTAGSTSHYFQSITDRYFEAVLEELGNHYGVKIGYTNVPYPPGRLGSTSTLLNDEVDIVSQINATGGDTQGLRRRTSRRFTCSMVASSQFIQIPNGSPLVAEIKSLNDLIERPDVRVCAGPLTTQTAAAFMPKHKVMTAFINDIAECDKRIKAGKADIMMNPLPDLSIAGFNDYKSVHTLLVAGTPLWVAAEGIVCDIPPEGGKGFPACRELNPL